MKVYAVDINSRLVDFHYFIHKLPPQIIKYINFLCYTCSSNISILSTIQARLLLYSLSKWRTSGLHSQLPGQEQLIPFSFFNLPSEDELRWIWTLFYVSIITCSWWILEDCFCSFTPYRFSFGEWRLSCRILSFSKSFKIFQNPQWNCELPPN